MATLQTARAFCRGQSDSLCGQMADRILDAALSQDPGARVRVDVALADVYKRQRYGRRGQNRLPRGPARGQRTAQPLSLIHI